MTDTETQACSLCALPVSGDGVRNDAGESFCCPGCRQVDAHLDDVEGVDREAIAEERSESDTAVTDDTSDVPADAERCFLSVDGMHCSTCEAFIERVAATEDGIYAAQASYVTETARIDYDPDVIEEATIRETLSRTGYEARSRETDPVAPDHEETTLWRLAGGVMCGMMVMLPYVIYIYPVHFGLYPDWMLGSVREQLEAGRHFFLFLFAFTTVVLFFTGKPLLRGAYVSLRTRRPSMDLLVSMAAVGAYLYSTVAVFLGRIDVYYDVTVAIVLVVTAGTYLEAKRKREATSLLGELTATRVDDAVRERADGTTETIRVDELAADDRVVLRPGERVPVDGALVEGTCTVDEAVVTGESTPVTKTKGDTVVGGSLVTDGSAVMTVGEGATSGLDRVVELVWDLQSDRGGVQGLADRLAVIFVPAVLVLSAIAAGVHLALGAGPTGALLVGLTVLIVSCPCALGLATPLAVASGLRTAMERGIVVFDETVFERVRDVDCVVFDKTGTLTTGEMTVRKASGPDELLAAAGALETRSTHPVGSAIARAFGPSVGGGTTAAAATDGGTVEDETSEDVTWKSPAARALEADRQESERTPGKAGPFRTSTVECEAQDADGPTVREVQTHDTGIEGVVDGERLLVGHPRLFEARGWSIPAELREQVRSARDDGDVPVVVGRADQDVTPEFGLAIVGDEPRPGWETVVTDLADRGVDVVVLTGDDDRAAGRFRDHDAVSNVFAGVPPAAKAETVARLVEEHRVAMVGDGTNDAPALARADLGIAMGGGTALAADAADVAIVEDDLGAIETTFALARGTRRRVRGNVAWAFVYNAVAIPLALTGLLNPLFAAAAMATSSLLVVTNSTRELLPEEGTRPDDRDQPEEVPS
jgi:Cu2+-exporting ATPase